MITEPMEVVHLGPIEKKKKQEAGLRVDCYLMQGDKILWEGTWAECYSRQLILERPSRESKKKPRKNVARRKKK